MRSTEQLIEERRDSLDRGVRCRGRSGHIPAMVRGTAVVLEPNSSHETEAIAEGGLYFVGSVESPNRNHARTTKQGKGADDGANTCTRTPKKTEAIVLMLTWPAQSRRS
jgi:hypothetical protein